MKAPPPEHKMMAGRYRLESALGSGGMGVVWRAFDEVLNRYVAIKVLPEPLHRDPVALERFRREALTAASLSHPQMANIFDFIDDGGPPAIVMELVEGETLAERLAAKRLPPSEAVRIAVGVLSALEAAHGAGIVHRDIKPGNILLARDGAVKVADFGIARAMTDATLTQDGFMMTTPHYMSPEQLRGAPAGPASDQFALGVVLYEMLTGQRPFDGESPAAIAMARLTQDPVPPSEIVPSLSRELELTVMRALAREPQDRFPDATAMRRALQGERAGATQVMPVPAVAGPNDETIQLGGSPAPHALAPPPSEGKMKIRRFAGALVVPLLGIFVLALLLGGAFAGAGTTEVPSFEGKTLSQARALAEKQDLGIGSTRYVSSARARDVVLGQSVDPGVEVDDGTRIALTLSRGCCVVPSFTDRTLDDARDLAREANVTLRVEYRPMKDEEGRIVAQDPAPREVVDPKDEVTVVVATEERDEKGEGKGNGGKKGDE